MVILRMVIIYKVAICWDMEENKMTIYYIIIQYYECHELENGVRVAFIACTYNHQNILIRFELFFYMLYLYYDYI
jgi:hypothetical protein